MLIHSVREHFLQARLLDDERHFKIALILFGGCIGLLLLNVFYLNYLLLHNKELNAKTITVVTAPQLIPTSTPAPCTDCLTPTVIPLQTALAVNTQSTAKDYFIPLGSGSSQASDWTDVPGAQVELDFASFSHIKAVYFETSVYVPSANESVSIRLYNVTDNHPVWNSDVMMDSGTTAHLISPALSYDTGLKLYQVQMKTQLQAPANLVQALIHVSVE